MLKEDSGKRDTDSGMRNNKGDMKTNKIMPVLRLKKNSRTKAKNPLKHRVRTGGFWTKSRADRNPVNKNILTPINFRISSLLYVSILCIIFLCFDSLDKA